MRDTFDLRTIHCPYLDKCSGCTNLVIPYKLQLTQKTESLTSVLRQYQLPFSGEIKAHTIGIQNFRTRSDLTIQGQTLGFYNDKSSLMDIESCPLWTEDLIRYFEKLRIIFEHSPIKIPKGSLRIRTSPLGFSGVWLDFSNQNIKELFEEQLTLLSLLQEGFVEIGQRRKRLVTHEGRLKLKDPSFEIWTRTSDGARDIDLLASIASFTQTGIVANKTLVQVVSKHIEYLKLQSASSAIEFGCGIGTFSFLLQRLFKDLTLCESDKASLEALTKSFALNQIQLPKILADDFQSRKTAPISDDTDYIFVNPPRAGIKNFLDPLFKQAKFRPKITYLSCFPETMGEDISKLSLLGYKLVKLDIVDQFPHTKHMEVVASLSV